MKPQRTLPSQLSLVLRVAGGLYLIYLAWSLRTALADNWLYGIAIAFFVIVGVLLAGFSGLALFKGEFQGGKADPKWDEPAEDTDLSHEDPEE